MVDLTDLIEVKNLNVVKSYVEHCRYELDCSQQVAPINNEPSDSFVKELNHPQIIRYQFYNGETITQRFTVDCDLLDNYKKQKISVTMT
eukprot:gene8312-136_t